MTHVPDIFDGVIGVLTFQVFVTPAVLFVVYYVGALFGPWVVWRGLGALARKLDTVAPDATELAERAAPARWWESAFLPSRLTGWRLWLSGLLTLLLFELGWRMLFEFLIAFFDMHDALIAIRNLG